MAEGAGVQQGQKVVIFTWLGAERVGFPLARLTRDLSPCQEGSFSFPEDPDSVVHTFLPMAPSQQAAKRVLQWSRRQEGETAVGTSLIPRSLGAGQCLRETSGGEG